MLGVRNHRLSGERVGYRATPNVGGALKPRYLVLHYTAGRSAASSIESLCTKKPQGSTEAQIGRCLELAELLVQHYALQDVLGHDDIARGRKKQGPGPAFLLASIASRALGRGDDQPLHFVVTTDGLNIRQGPDASFDCVAPALAWGTPLGLIEPGSRWSKVEVDGPSDVEGWVNNHFIARVLEARRSGPPRRRAPAKKAARKAAPKRAKKAANASASRALRKPAR